MMTDLWKARWSKEVYSGAGAVAQGCMLTILAENPFLKCQGIRGPLLASDLYLYGAHKLTQAHNT